MFKPMHSTTDISITKEQLLLSQRPRRNRKSAAIRNLIQETRLHPSHLVAPFFITEGSQDKIAIPSMPGVYRHTLDAALREIEALATLSVQCINLFFYISEEKKDLSATEATATGTHFQHVIASIKKNFPEICVMADIALDPFTSHGHDGIVDARGAILNDATIRILGEMALRAAEAGIDIVSPSDMMDGRVGYIRTLLDACGFHEVSILSYAVKYTSNLYGPFRDALDSAPKFGDKKTYQMNPANAKEALLECSLDEKEGADMLLIKPALTSLDIISEVRKRTMLPLGAYQVSGEYSMIKAAAAQGWINEENAFLETLLCIKRAGADFIFTYAAKQVAELLRHGF